MKINLKIINIYQRILISQIFRKNIIKKLLVGTHKGLGMVFMPNKTEKIEECKSICEEEAKKLKINKTF